MEAKRRRRSATSNGLACAFPERWRSAQIGEICGQNRVPGREFPSQAPRISADDAPSLHGHHRDLIDAHRWHREINGSRTCVKFSAMSASCSGLASVTDFALLLRHFYPDGDVLT